MTKKGRERLVSGKISGALENTPANRAILKDEPIKTSLGDWKAKISESGFFGKPKEGEDIRAFYTQQSQQIDDFLLPIAARLNLNLGRSAVAEGKLNLDFELDERRITYFAIEIGRLFANEMKDEAIKRYDIHGISQKIAAARKDKTFRELRKTIAEVVPEEVMNMKVYGDKDVLGLELLDSLLPEEFFEVRTMPKDEMFNGQDEEGNELLEREISDEQLPQVSEDIAALVRSNYNFDRQGEAKAEKLIGLIMPSKAERARVLATIGIKD